jgi:tetratricopeptide (TPR) repeat protein
MKPRRAHHDRATRARKVGAEPKVIVPDELRASGPGWIASRSVLGSVAILVVIILAVYGPLRHYDFVSFDDPSYVRDNPYVAAGLTGQGIAWAFSAAHAGYWIPLTWLSYMADVQVAGVNAGGHHVANVLLHVVNTLLLFALLRSMTGATGRSLLVAALFAVHPLHVESVAWVTERKDVLSTLFLLLALWSYVGYVRRPSTWRYAMVVVWFVCGLMAKPMVVTLPFLLLLLDIWPLARVPLGRRPADPDHAAASKTTWMSVVREKISLVAVAAAAGVVTLVAQHQAGAVADKELLGPMMRVATAVTAYATYVWKMVWPAGLAAFYPYQTVFRPWAAGGALIILIGISILAFRLRRYPYVAVGWLWYLISLAPVAGFIQVGNQSSADRFTYVPLIGLFVIVSWGAPALLPTRQRVVGALAVSAVVVCAVVANVQVQTWKNDDTLWRHALDVIPDDFIAHNFLGRRLYDQGQTIQAAYHFSETVRLAPAFADGHNNLGLVLLKQGRLDDAVEQFREAIRLNPTAEDLNDLGMALARRGDLDEALARGLEAIKLKPDLAEAHYDVGLTLARSGRLNDALRYFADARHLRPDLAVVHQSMGEALAQLGRLDEAIVAYREALRLDPAFSDAHYHLGFALQAQGHVDEAVAQYTEAVRLVPDRADIHNDLGFALASLRRIGEAIPHFTEATRLAPNFALAHLNFGIALASIGRLQEAADQFRTVLRLDPNNDGALRALARLQKH